MWKAYLRVDAWVLSKIQDAYLWLLDRTGVYVGTLMFVSYVYVVGIFFWAYGTSWILIAILASVGITSGQRYLWQDKGKNERFNAASISIEGWALRHPLNLFVLFFTVFDAVILDPISASSKIVFLLYSYLLIVKIRNRDKKPFFKPAEQHDLAMESSNVGL